MARFVPSIFDIDEKEVLSLEEIDAMMRMVHYTKEESCNDAMAIIREEIGSSLTITLSQFLGIVANDNSIIQPALDINSRIIEKTTGAHASGKRCWDLYREKRREKFGDVVIVPLLGKKSPSRLESSADDDADELSGDFLSSLFRRVERNVNAPDGYDSRLPEEAYVDKLRCALSDAEGLLRQDYTVDRLEEKKALRKRLWNLVDEIKEAHLNALYAELDRDLGLWERGAFSSKLEYSSEDDVHDLFERLIDSFESNWGTFAESYENRFGGPNTRWERLLDPDNNVNFYFQWQTGERATVGSQPPAICEVCDHLLQLTDCKCFNCDAELSARNRRKYRGRLSLESIEEEGA